MAEIKCPMCGKPNPADRAVCQFCEARLKPLTDDLSRSQPPIHPGEEPTDMDTGQLERTLPGWLREVRQQSRESADPQSGKPAKQQENQADLLAGFQSQSKGEEDIPDWLAGLRGEGSQAGFAGSAEEEDDLAALRSMLGEGAPGPEENEPARAPGWGSEPGAGQAPGSPDEQEPVAQEPFPSGADLGWDADFGAESTLSGESREDETPIDSELPAWLRDASSPQAGEPEGELPAWLSTEEPHAESEIQPSGGDEGELPAWLQEKEQSPEETADTGLPAWLASLGEDESDEGFPPQDVQLPGAKSTTDWLAAFDEEKTSAGTPGSSEEAIKSTTDWLASLEDETTGTQPQQEAPPDRPDWLSEFGQELAERASLPEDEEPATTSGLPSWLAALGEESGEPDQQEQVPTAEDGEAPGWLASLSEQSEAEQETPSLGEESVEQTQTAAQGEIPDWLAAMGAEAGESEQPAGELDSSMFASDLPGDETGAPPAFVDDEGKPIAREDVEAIFSMDMPDWLSETEATSEFEPAPPAGGEQADELRPAELPSWVQAMRPVESVISETEGAASEAQPVEERGPLAGLRGVLPATAGIGPFSKPKGYSLKLQVSEDQQSSAALLETILAEEVTPRPVITQRVALTQRVLRWVIAGLLLLVVGVSVYFSPQINQVPTSAPLETSDAWDYIRDSLPANAPVLLVFDYEAARAGEMEAAAAPLIDQMLTLKAPRLSLVASTPVASGLAERFMGLLQFDRTLTRNESFVNLGYLPGGATGVQAFSVNPQTTKPLTTSGEGAWTTPVLQDVAHLSEFQAIFLLTDDIESARIWIEQTEAQRGEARFLVISSAQSAPMLLPYERSGQVDGMVTGLEGGAPIERANSGRPGMARRYWDAFGFGLLAAVVMIAIGSLWSLISGWRTGRGEQREG